VWFRVVSCDFFFGFWVLSGCGKEWAPLVEPGPKRREEWLARVAYLDQQLDNVSARRRVWAKLNDALSALEGARGAELAKPPPLAGKDWADLRHELSYRGDADGGLEGGDGDPGDDDDAGANALTNLADLRQPGDQVGECFPKKEGFFTKRSPSSFRFILCTKKTRAKE